MNQAVERTRRELFGDPISPGVVISSVFVFKQIALDALEMVSFSIDNPTEEFNRLDRAISKSRDQIITITDRLMDEKRNSAIQDIFSAQLHLLNETAFIQELKSLVHTHKMNIEHVIASQIRALENRFSSINDELIRSKFLDVEDVYHRILRNLLEIEHVRTNPMQRVNSPVIVVSERLVPSDFALLDFKKIVGIIIEEGSKVSHVAVISKSLEIPTIINVPGAGSLIHKNDMVIIDGYTGKIIVNPSHSETFAYKEKSEHSPFTTSKRPLRNGGYCETRDGRRVRLEANIGSVREAEIAMAYGAEGIGLLRSELFYMSCSKMPSIDDEVEFYRKIIAITKRKPITIRLLDLGADKTLPYLHSFDEENPQLGHRGMRYLFRHPEILRCHIESILTVCRLAHIKIALPFITTIEDLDKGIGFLKEGCRNLKMNFEALHIGIMVEIPSVALSMRSFLPKIEFVNIGTNDLIQYIFAASREDSYLEEYRQTSHPVNIRLIRNIVSAANFRNKAASVCGEMASDIRTAALLIGSGATQLSMQPSSIPVIRQFVIKQSFTELQKMVRKILSLESAKEVQDHLESFLLRQNHQHDKAA